MVRAALKEPLKAKAKVRETIYFRQSLWKDGVPQKQGGWRRLHLTLHARLPCFVFVV